MASPAKLITITNRRGAELSLTDFGAAITGFKLPISRTRKIDLILGYDNLDAYRAGTAYLGATVGRCANRIAYGKIPIAGYTYTLDKNEGGKHTLHSGFHGYEKRLWRYAVVNENTIRFSLTSEDGDQGFPGNAQIEVEYFLDDNNVIVISYRAYANRTTCFNLTNHSYFNLNGYANGRIDDHVVQIDANAYTPVNEELIPTGEIRHVGGTPFDFRHPKMIGASVDAGSRQIRYAGGFDHNFVLNHHDGHTPVASVFSPRTGIRMEVYTDMPGLQFYTGNSLPEGEIMKKGATIHRRGAFCMETQFYPDAPHFAQFPSPIVRMGEIFRSVTKYAFTRV
ncbi:MAG: galactose mutarotase [Clostridiales Family XIII bacterium]|jgi:aldose 1-epimerase|nr:galactose mutarotase [Clostridiales Family XIII bacterium]